MGRAPHHSFTRRKLSDTGAPLESRGVPQCPSDSPEHARLPSTAGERSRRRTCTNRHGHGRQAGWAAPRTATSRRLRRRVGGPAARPGGRVREPRSPRRPAALAPRACRAERARGESACQCMGWPRRAPRQPAPRTSGRAARLPARSSPPIAAGQRASGRPRRHSVASAAAAALVARRPICTWWAMHTPAAHRPRGAGSSFVMNSRATRRAGELAAADPANRARLGRRLQLAARSWMEKLPRGAPFGVELERAIDHGALGGREAVRCAVRRLCGAQLTTPHANTLSRGHPARNTRSVSILLWAPRAAVARWVSAH